jgi:hypothetical protein
VFLTLPRGWPGDFGDTSSDSVAKSKRGLLAFPVMGSKKGDEGVLGDSVYSCSSCNFPLFSSIVCDFLRLFNRSSGLFIALSKVIVAVGEPDRKDGEDALVESVSMKSSS